MALTLVTGPASAPLLLDEIKAHLRIDTDREDATLELYLEAAVVHLEGRGGWLNRTFLTQIWDWTLDRFPVASPHHPHEEFIVPLPPLQSVTSITYLDAFGVVQTVDPLTYTVDTKSEPGRIAPAYGLIWPVSRSYYGYLNVVTVRFVAGYPAVSEIPAPIRLALLGLVSDYYEHRDADSPLPGWVERLLANYRILRA